MQDDLRAVKVGNRNRMASIKKTLNYLRSFDRLGKQATYTLLNDDRRLNDLRNNWKTLDDQESNGHPGNRRCKIRESNLQTQH